MAGIVFPQYNEINPSTYCEQFWIKLNKKIQMWYGNGPSENWVTCGVQNVLLERGDKPEKGRLM